MYGCTQNRELAVFFPGLDPIKKIMFTASVVYADQDSAMNVLRISNSHNQSPWLPFLGTVCYGSA